MTTGFSVGLAGTDMVAAFREEAVRGVLDAGDGDWTVIRATSITPSVQPEFTTPNEIRDDELTGSPVLTNFSPSFQFSGPMTKLAHSPLMAAMISSAFVAGTASNGTADTSFSIILRYGTGNMEIFTGCFPTSMAISISRGSEVNVTFNFIASGAAHGTAPTETVTAINTYPVMSPLEATSSVSWKGSGLSSVLSANLNFTRNGAGPLFAIFNGTNSIGLSKGAMAASVTSEIYFNDFTYKTDLLNSVVGAVVMALRDPAGDGYDFTFPAAKIVNHPNPISGSNAFTANIEWQMEPGPSSSFITIDEVTA